MLNKWEIEKIIKKDKILEFEFLENNNFITLIEDDYFYLNTSFPEVEEKYYSFLNESLANELNLTDVHKEIDSFIKKLNKYNEAKEIAENLMGKLADLRNCTIKEIHEEYGLKSSED